MNSTITMYMEESNTVNQYKNEQTKLCNQEKDHPTNLLDKFSPEKYLKETQNSNLSQPNLNLRLSLGSLYGENPKENPLTRSSSIAGTVTLTNNSGELERRFLSLERTCSLPTGAVQEQRLITLQELQTMRRIEAKNRFIQKQRSFKEAKQKDKFPVTETLPSLPPEVADWAAASAANSPALCRAIVKIKTQGLSGNKRGVEGSATQNAPSRIPKVVEGSSAPNARSSYKLPSVPKNADPVVTSATTSNRTLVKPVETKPENAYEKARTYRGNFEDNGMDVMRQMPSVSTTGEGPNGRRVEGFLYRYKRGHVCIVCACHGRFLSPGEFVKHADGKDVSNPMKHITVYSTFAP